MVGPDGTGKTKKNSKKLEVVMINAKYDSTAKQQRKNGYNAGYNKQLESPIADLINAPYSPPTAGAITAGLFLKKFVDNAKEFLHFDIYAWQNSSEPGKPKGGKMQAVRALIEFLESYQK